MEKTETDLGIPEPPKEVEKIPADSQEKLQRWISLVKSISPDIKTASVLDKEFDYEKIKEAIHEFLARPSSLMEVENFEKEDVLFYVALPNSLTVPKKTYFTKDLFVFCKKNMAFYMEWGFESRWEDRDDPEDDDFVIQCEMRSPKYISWEHVIKVITACMKELYNEVPPLS